MRSMSVVRHLWRLVAVGLVVVVATTSNVVAQDKSILECKANPGPEEIEKAKEHMAAGVAFMQDPDGPKYEEAYSEFRKAYELSCSNNALQNLGICSQNLELDGEAILYYEKYIEKKGDRIDPAVKQQVERDVRTLKASVAWVTLSTDKEGVKITDVRTPRRGSPVTNEYDGPTQAKTFGIHPGRHKFTARLAGHEDQIWEIDIKIGSKHNHAFYMTGIAPDAGPDTDGGPDPEGERPIPVYAWVATGITGALGVTAIILAVMASGKRSDYDEKNDGTLPAAEIEELQDDVKKANILADVFLITTGVAAVTTLILFLTRPTVYPEGSEPADEDDEDTARFGVDWLITPTVDPHGGGAAVFTTRF